MLLIAQIGPIKADTASITELQCLRDRDKDKESPMEEQGAVRVGICLLKCKTRK